MQTATAQNLGDNAPATVVGWAKDGGARVEFLSSTPHVPLGSTLTVHVRPDPRSKFPIDFSYLQKQGLRTGGVVLLRRLLKADGEWTVRYVEPVVNREAHGRIFVMQGAGACILPAPAGKMVVDHCLVAPFRDSFPVRTLSEGMAKVSTALDQPCLFGEPGLLFTGRMRDGSLAEFSIGGEGPAKPMDLLSRLVAECPKDIIEEARTTGTKRTPWRLVPFFKAPIPPERKSRMSAIATNHPYGSLERPQWTTANVVMAVYDGRWHAADATPTDDTAEPMGAFDLMTA
jgi:hypothetical protein